MRAGAQIPEGERPFSYPVWSPGLQGICKHGPGDRVLLCRPGGFPTAQLLLRVQVQDASAEEIHDLREVAAAFFQEPPQLRSVAAAQEKDLTLSVGLSHVAGSPVLQRIRG